MELAALDASLAASTRLKGAGSCPGRAGPSTQLALLAPSACSLAPQQPESIALSLPSNSSSWAGAASLHHAPAASLECSMGVAEVAADSLEQEAEQLLARVRALVVIPQPPQPPLSHADTEGLDVQQEPVTSAVAAPPVGRASSTRHPSAPPSATSSTWHGGNNLPLPTQHVSPYTSHAAPRAAVPRQPGRAAAGTGAAQGPCAAVSGIATASMDLGLEALWTAFVARQEEVLWGGSAGAAAGVRASQTLPHTVGVITAGGVGKGSEGGGMGEEGVAVTACRIVEGAQLQMLQLSFDECALELAFPMQDYMQNPMQGPMQGGQRGSEQGPAAAEAGAHSTHMGAHRSPQSAVGTSRGNERPGSAMGGTERAGYQQRTARRAAVRQFFLAWAVLRGGVRAQMQAARLMRWVWTGNCCVSCTCALLYHSYAS